MLLAHALLVFINNSCVLAAPRESFLEIKWNPECGCSGTETFAMQGMWAPGEAGTFIKEAH